MPPGMSYTAFAQDGSANFHKLATAVINLLRTVGLSGSNTFSFAALQLSNILRSSPISSISTYLSYCFSTATPDADIWPGKYPESRKKYPQFFDPYCDKYSCWALKMIFFGTDEELQDLIGLGLEDGKAWLKEQGL